MLKVTDARTVERATGLKLSGQAVFKYLYGESFPKHGFIAAFADAFEITARERVSVGLHLRLSGRG